MFLSLLKKLEPSSTPKPQLVETVRNALNAKTICLNSQTINNDLFAIVSANGSVSPEDWASTIKKCHTQFCEPNIVTEDDAKTHDPYGFIANELGWFKHMETPEFLADLKSIGSSINDKTGQQWFLFQSGRFSRSAVEAAKFKHIVRTRTCWCGNPSDGAEGAWHSPSSCSP